MAPPAASISPVCCVPFPASAPRRASPSSLRRLPRFAARSSGGGGTRPEPKPGNLSDVGCGAEGQSDSSLGFYSLLLLVSSRR